MCDFRRLGLALAATISLVFGVAACGEDSDSGPTTNGAAVERDEQGADQGKAATSKQKPAAPPPPEGTDTGTERPPTPAHEDSGGGTEQFRVPGGDNSVQEFGSEASSSEFEEAAAALHAFLDARAAGDWATACDYLAADIVASFEQLADSQQQDGASCPQLLRGLSGPSTAKARKEAAIADVGSIRVEGERGFALYHGVGGVDYAISMTREDGGWKVATLAGIPIS
jgi:hypothetical protein